MKKLALITGGSRGIGRAAAEKLYRDGWKVAICCSNSMDEAESVVRALGEDAAAFRADVSDMAAVDALFDAAEGRFGQKVELLVNNSGVAWWGLLTDMTAEDIDRIVDTDLKGTIYCARRAAKSMAAEHTGAIVNVSSVWGVYGASCETAYSAAKAGVIGLTRALAKELGPAGVRVNCVAPGVVDTVMNSRLTAEDMAALKDETPLGRIGRPEEIAEAICFLASDRAGFITGQVLGVDGGFGM